MPNAQSAAAALVGLSTGIGAFTGHFSGIGAGTGAAAGAMAGGMLGGAVLATAARHDAINEAVREVMEEDAHVAGGHARSEREERHGEDFTGSVILHNPDGSTSLGVPYNAPAFHMPPGYGQPAPHISLPMAREHSRQMYGRERRRAAVREVLGRNQDINSSTIIRNPLHRLH